MDAATAQAVLGGLINSGNLKHASYAASLYIRSGMANVVSRAGWDNMLANELSRPDIRRMAGLPAYGGAAAAAAGPVQIPAPYPYPLPKQRSKHEPVPEQQQEDAVAEQDEEQLQHENVYQNYKPSRLDEGRPHPDPIMETASLSGVLTPKISYKHHLQADVQAGRISSAQLETVVLACQRFEQRLEQNPSKPAAEPARAGFFLGDGAGVGKGRQIAALVKEYWLTGGRRILWMSTSNDLRFDARRDLDDMCCSAAKPGDLNVPVFPKNKDSVPKGDLLEHYKEGVVFITYSLLISKAKNVRGAGAARRSSNGGAASSSRNNNGDPSNAADGTGMGQGGRAYKSAMAKAKKKQKQEDSLMSADSRLMQIVDWLSGPDNKGECLIVLDECHRAKNLLDANGNSTLTGLAVEKLQELLPNARVLYSSATGASEPQNMLYMTRVGTFGYETMEAMVKTLTTSGLGAVEMFCQGLKGMGAYLSRTLSYSEAEFRLEQIELDPVFKIMYDRAAHIWQLVLAIVRQLPKQKPRDLRLGLYWAGHQRFFRQMLVAAKVKECARLSLEALDKGMCVVIGLQSTGEANTTAAREEEGDTMDDFVSAPRVSLSQFIAKHLFKDCELLGGREAMTLLVQVTKTLQAWQELLPADKAALALEEEKMKEKKKEARAAQLREERQAAKEAQRQAAAAAAGGASTSAGAAAAAEVEDDDDDDDDDEEVALEGEKSLDEVLQAKRQLAVLTGNMIDLTADVDESAIQSAQADLAAAARDEALRRWRAREEALQAQVKHASEAVAEAQAEYEQQLAKELAAAGLAAPPPAAAANAGAVAVGDDAALEDSDAAEAPQQPAAGQRRSARGRAQAAAAASPDRKRRRQVVDEDDEEVEVVVDDEEDEDDDQGEDQKAEDEAAGDDAAMEDAVQQSAGARRSSRRQPARGASKPAAQPAAPATAKRGAALPRVPTSRSGTDLTATAAAAAEPEVIELLDSSDEEEKAPAPPPPKRARGAAATVAAPAKAPAAAPAAAGKGKAAQAKQQAAAPAAAAGRRQPARRAAAAAKVFKEESSQSEEEDDEEAEEASEEEGEEGEGEEGSGSEASQEVESSSGSDSDVEIISDDDDDSDFMDDDSPAPKGRRGGSRLGANPGAAKGGAAAAAAVVAAAVSGRPRRGAAAAAAAGGAAQQQEEEEDPRAAGLKGVQKQRVLRYWRELLGAKRKLATAQSTLDAHVASKGETLAKAEQEAAIHRPDPVEEERIRQLRLQQQMPAFGGLPRAPSGGGAADDPAMVRPGEYRYAVKNKPLGKGGDKSNVTGASGKRGGGGRGGGRGRPRSRAGSEDLAEEDDEEAGGDDEDALLDMEDDEMGDDDAVGPTNLSPNLERVRAMMLRLVDAMELPANPLDQLTDLLGGPNKVAEMTGRKGLMARREDGTVVYQVRREEESQKMVNIKEKESFMTGEKLVAIISDAASTGISLQADRRVANQRRRFHITLELPWSADRAIQQFGRSHRSNQSSAPVYCLLVTKCGGEYRFAGAVAKRLASLGALLQGDQRAMGAGANLKSYDIDNDYGKGALERVYNDTTEKNTPMPGVQIPDKLPPGMAYSSHALDQAEGGDLTPQRNEFFGFMQDCMVKCGMADNTTNLYGAPSVVVDEKKRTDVARFLNRMLGLSLEEQDMMFNYFSQTLDAVVRTARSEGKYQDGMEVLRDVTVRVKARQEIHRDLDTGAPTWYFELDIDDGLSWERACEQREAAIAEMRRMGAPDNRIAKVGFYIMKNNWLAYGKPHVILATEVAKKFEETRIATYRVRRPYQITSNLWKDHEMNQKYRIAKDDKEARELWQWWFTTLNKSCLHGPNCSFKRARGYCYNGSRHYPKFMISGAVLPIMRTLFDTVMTSGYGRVKDKKNPPRALRCTVEEDTGEKDAEGKPVMRQEVVVGLNLLREDAQLLLERLQM